MAVSDKGPTVIGVSLMFEVFAFTAVMFRLWTLQILKRRFLVHDIFLFTAFILTTALVAITICTVRYGGLGKHAYDLVTEPEKLLMFGKLLLTGNLVWVVAMTFVRLSILSLYIHIFSLHDRFRIACYVLMAAAVSWGVAVFILLALDCQPFAFNWDKTIPGGYCVNIAASYLSAHVINLTIDSSIAFLPTPVLWGLHMPLRRKIGITILFALGSAVCVFSLIRIALYRIVLGFDSIDFTWTAPTPVIFTVGEPSLGCVIACLPLLRPIAEKFSSSQAGSWIKSWVSSISGTTKVTKGSSFEDGNPKDNYQVAVKTGVSADGQWQRLSDDQRAIMVSHEYDQQSYSMGEISR